MTTALGEPTTSQDPFGILEEFPLPIAIYDREGILASCNAACERLFGVHRSAVIGRFNVLQDPRSVQHGSHELFARALAGEAFERDYVTRYAYSDAKDAPGLWMRPYYFPLRNASGGISHVVVIYRDVTSLVEHEAQIREARVQLAAQQRLVLQLSSPVTRLWQGILLLPLVGSIDAERAALITEQLLAAVARDRAELVILDVAGVPWIDGMVAGQLISTVNAVRLLGSEVVLVGIGSEAAQNIVQLGIDLSQLVTLGDLQAGLAYAFARKGLSVVRALHH